MERQQCKFLFGIGGIYYRKNDPGREGLRNPMLGSWVSLCMTLTCSTKLNFVPLVPHLPHFIIDPKNDCKPKNFHCPGGTIQPQNPEMSP